MKRLVIISLIIMCLMMACQVRRDIEWKVTCGNCGFYFGLDCHCEIDDIQFCPKCGEALKNNYKITKVQ